MTSTKWAIKYTYTDSDSFNSWEGNGELAIRWTELDNAKAALKLIRDVYILRKKIDHYRYNKTDENLTEQLIQITGNDYYSCSIAFTLDDGTKQNDYCPWQGWGASLKSIWIEEAMDEPDDNDMRFSPEDLPWNFYEKEN